MRLVQVVLLCNLFRLNLFFDIEDDRKTFIAWKAKFHKVYKSQTEELLAFTRFHRNLREIRDNNDKFNKGLTSQKLGLWEESDQDTNAMNRKFNKLLNLKPINSRAAELDLPNIPRANVNSIDYVKLGYVNEVQRQGRCGSCYTFAAAGALEAEYFKVHNKLVKFSEQMLLNCARGGSLRTYGCKGGVIGDVFEWIKWNGIASNETYIKYSANDTLPCFYNRATSVTRLSRYFWPHRIDEIRLKDLVCHHGPVAVAIDASLSSFLQYKSGVYRNSSCSTNVNHAVLIVGYGVDPEHGDYWYIKNSYGPNWGDKGFFKLARGVNQCGLLVNVVYPEIY